MLSEAKQENHQALCNKRFSLPAQKCEVFLCRVEKANLFAFVGNRRIFYVERSETRKSPSFM